MKKPATIRQVSESKTVFRCSAVIAIAIALWAILGKFSFRKMADTLMKGLMHWFSWFYLAMMLLFVLFSMGLAFSRYGSVRLGKKDEKPEYGTLSWFAMLFAAGMGVGLVFWGVSEPLSHYTAPMSGITPLTLEAKRFSIRSAIMHWGLHPWACYAVIGLGLAYFQFHRGESSLVSSIFQPMLGRNRADGLIGKIIDILTAVITVIGVATSFGMGCLQVCAGLNLLFHVPDTAITWAIFTVVIGFVYIATAVTGLSRGISRMSDLNMVTCVCLMLVSFLLGPKMEILGNLAYGFRDYLLYFFPDSLRMSAEGDSTWILNWRVFYWAWWVSWAPFVGVFIARISRGRTIREFVLGVMVVPMLVSTVWFSIFGGLAIHAAGQFSLEELLAITASPETALFHIFQTYRGGFLLCIIAILLVIMFFITSANSATFVLSMLTSGGNPNPPDSKKIFWGVLIGIMAFALILAGGLHSIQTISIVIAFPYLIILILIGVNLVMGLREDHPAKR